MKSSTIPFPYIANNLAIDFVNTKIFDREEEIDLLNSAEDLLNWVQGAKLSVSQTAINDVGLNAALVLRNALARIFTSVLKEQEISSKDLSILNRHLLEHSNEEKLIKTSHKLELRPISKNFSLERLLGCIANEAAQLLASDKLEKLKKCANPKCVLLFMDTSKSGRRRWCSMEVCGNRAKAANHYLNNK